MYVFEKELGKGAYGNVYRCYLKSNKDHVVAIKLIDLQSKKAKNKYSRFLREIQVIKNLDHPNIV